MSEATITHSTDYASWKVSIRNGLKTFHHPPEHIPDLNYQEPDDGLTEKILSALSRVDGLPPHNVLLKGPRGSGKTIVWYRTAQILGVPLYYLGGSYGTSRGDLLGEVCPQQDGSFGFATSALFEAMENGALFVFDDMDKIPESSLTPLLSVLNENRVLHSSYVGSPCANENFMFCATANREISNAEIRDRLSPVINVSYPSKATTEKILRSRLTKADEKWFKLFMHECKSDKLSPRYAIQVLTFAYKMHTIAYQKGTAKNTESDILKYIRIAKGSDKKDQEEQNSTIQKKTYGKTTKDTDGLEIFSLLSGQEQDKSKH